MRRASPSRLTSAAPSLRPWSPAVRTSCARNASSVPDPCTPTLIGGSPGISARRATRPPAGSLPLSVSSTPSVAGMNLPLPSICPATPSMRRSSNSAATPSDGWRIVADALADSLAGTPMTGWARSRSASSNRPRRISMGNCGNSGASGSTGTSGSSDGGISGVRATWTCPTSTRSMVSLRENSCSGDQTTRARSTASHSPSRSASRRSRTVRSVGNEPSILPIEIFASGELA